MAVLGSSLPANVLAPDSFSTACSNSVWGPRFLTFSTFKHTTGRHIYIYIYIYIVKKVTSLLSYFQFCPPVPFVRFRHTITLCT